MAMDVLLLLHEPPDVADAKVPVEPTQITVGPVITAGSVLTVNVAMRLHPVGNV